MPAGKDVAYVCGSGAAGQHCVRLSVGHLRQLLLIFLLDGRGWRPKGAGVGRQGKQIINTERYKLNL